MPDVTARGIPAQEVVFDSWGGQFSDNPRAISEAMHRSGTPVRQRWVLREEVMGPPWAERVVAGSRAHVEHLERADVIIANNVLPPFRKRPGTLYAQTWHGTPLKRIGFDLPAGDPGYLAHLAQETPLWDLMLSPNAASTPRLRSAFRYAGPVLETGYPRTDALAGAGPRRGIRTVLYAPTFRRQGTFDLRLDVGALADALDADILLRLHHFAPHAAPVRHPRVRDVTAHPDLRELLLAADALVTDYSSVMVDFAVTRRPIVLFADDLADHRDGFYVDLETIAPGPIVDTTADVVAALREEPRDYSAFRETYCHLDDGRAADRAVTTIMSAARGG